MTLEPSRGGIGSKLNTASTQLTRMPTLPISMSTVIFILIAIIITNNQQMAITIFAPGPAKATHIMPFFPLRSALKFIGTGLAQPNINPDEESNKTKGIVMVPIGSVSYTHLTLPTIYSV